jgi:hypothetical protein
MPVWAAIIAASSVPFFYRFFDVKHEWKRVASKEVRW